MDSASYIYTIALPDAQILLIAPLQRLTAILNLSAAREICADSSSSNEQVVRDVRAVLAQKAKSIPQINNGAITAPLFLGLLPTRGCSMACRYCDFAAGTSHQLMSQRTAQKALDNYLQLLSETGQTRGEVHFFGGEPLFAFDRMVSTLAYARQQAQKHGIDLFFEMTSNGFYPANHTRWAAENLDCIVLSFDGLADVQNHLRPGVGGIASFETVAENAAIFSSGQSELIVRSCVNALNCDRLSDWAAYLSENYRLSAVCFEPMIDSSLAQSNHVACADPLSFVRNFFAAKRIFQTANVPLIYAAADIRGNRASLCPLGRDALIVDPQGVVNGCWQIDSAWRMRGLDFQLGMISDNGFDLSQERVDVVHALCEENRRSCQKCFCYFYCAGGCVLNHNQENGKKNPDFCRLTRLITLLELLSQLGQDDLLQSILEQDDPFALVRDVS